MSDEDIRQLTRAASDDKLIAKRLEVELLRLGKWDEVFAAVREELRAHIDAKFKRASDFPKRADGKPLPPLMSAAGQIYVDNGFAKIAVVITAWVFARCRHWPPSLAKRAMSESYPFGPRSNWPYKTWLKAVQKAEGRKSKLSAKAKATWVADKTPTMFPEGGK